MRFPYAALALAVSVEYFAKLVTSIEQAHVPEAWSDATGKPVLCKSQGPIGTFSLSKDPKVDVRPPLESGAARIEEELSRMRSVLALEGACQVPDTILAKN